jgi:hypothetical protein
MPDEITPEGSAQGTPPAQDLQAELDRYKRDYAASSSEAKRLKQERDFFEQQTQQFTRPAPSQDPFQRLRDEGWPVDSLLPAIERIAEQKAAARFDPIVRGMEARSKVLASNPDYGKYENEAMQYINGDPNLADMYNAMIQVRPDAAMDWAFLKYGESRRRAQPEGNGNATVSKQGRADAQIPSSRSGEKRNTNAGDSTDDVFRAAKADFAKTGNPRAAEAAFRAKLRNAIPDSFFEK